MLISFPILTFVPTQYISERGYLDTIVSFDRQNIWKYLHDTF